MQDDLIQRAQAGDHAAFQPIVHAYTPLVWRLVRTLIADRTLAEDIVQDAWLDAWRGLRSFDPHRPMRPWLVTIIANRCRMANRRRHLPIVALDELHPGPVAWDEDVADAMIRSETDAELTTALVALPCEQRRLIELRYFAKLDIAEIALVTGIPTGTVKSRISRTLAKMRSYLHETEESAQRKETDS
jgi:RNA polymerase sigma-70 factor (ECF subfamily)